MHSRNINFKLRPKRIAEFSRILEDEVIPLLQREKGFDDVISFIAPDRNEAVAISLWDKKEDAEADNQKTYPEILRAVAGVIEGTPKVQIFEVEIRPMPKDNVGNFLISILIIARTFCYLVAFLLMSTFLFSIETKVAVAYLVVAVILISI